VGALQLPGGDKWELSPPEERRDGPLPSGAGGTKLGQTRSLLGNRGEVTVEKGRSTKAKKGRQNRSSEKLPRRLTAYLFEREEGEKR